MFRYKLIAPVLGNHIHTAPTEKDGWKKCYNEFKQSGGGPVFSIMNIDTLQKYNFKTQPKLSGGSTPDINLKLVELEAKIISLETRLDSLQQKYKEDILPPPPPPAPKPIVTPPLVSPHHVIAGGGVGPTGPTGANGGNNANANDFDNKKHITDKKTSSKHTSSDRGVFGSVFIKKSDLKN